jgi:hypothetical protein
MRVTTALKSAVEAFKTEMAKPTHSYLVLENGEVRGMATTDQELDAMTRGLEGKVMVFRVEAADERLAAITKRQAKAERKAEKAMWERLGLRRFAS